MVREVNRLTALRVKKLETKGWYPDGLGLYLQISKSGSKSWVYRYTRDGKQRWHGLGAVSETNSLSVARQQAERCRQLLREGIDPIHRKEQQALQRALDDARSMTFDQCAAAYIEAHNGGNGVEETPCAAVAKYTCYLCEPDGG